MIFNSPILSICIPSYNRPKQLAELLQTIDCNISDIEVVICEDLAPKRVEVRAVIEDFINSSDLSVHYFENEYNLGFDGNIRRLVECAHGEYVMFMGDDDLFVGDALDNFIAFIKINRDKDSKFRILFIGSVTDRKKPHLIVEALNSIKKENVELLIVGPTPNSKYLETLKNLISEYALDDNVKFFGEVDRERVKSFYSEINLMILPSVSEGLARVIFESQATACPVLVTDAPGMGDIVIEGQTGYIFESNSIESLATKINQVEENYEEAIHIGTNAKDFILKNYSAENFKFSFKKIFDSV